MRQYLCRTSVRSRDCQCNRESRFQYCKDKEEGDDTGGSNDDEDDNDDIDDKTARERPNNVAILK